MSNLVCVKLKTCLPSRSFCLTVLYSFGFAAWSCACADAGIPNATARNKPTAMGNDFIAQVPPLSESGRGKVYQRPGFNFATSISRLHAARQPKAADLGRVVGRARLVVIAHVPKGAVIGRIHRESSVVLPAIAVCLRSRAVRQDGFGEG